MKIGYARVSTDEQNLDMQLQALKAAGCDRIYEDRGMSGAATTRPGLRRAMKALRAGDVLIVWRLDRLGRSLPHLIDVIAGLNGKEVGLQSLREQIDTTSPAGRFYLHMLAALAEFERELIRDRAIAGMAAARKRGVRLGRPRKLSPQQVNTARQKITNGEKLEVAAKSFGVSGLTLRRALAE
ncbi:MULTISPECIES: recombinase family protein [Hyphomicrobiales]|uniref:recombinase family protein n=1 Tax=Hyphomicrobiales TaxID=356 RepID=UPI00194E0ADF|nr:recombinase family protein [Brucella anthropi]MBM6395302.1 recombinase family protein [Brucella anthropi]